MPNASAPTQAKPRDRDTRLTDRFMAQVWRARQPGGSDHGLTPGLIRAASVVPVTACSDSRTAALREGWDISHTRSSSNRGTYEEHEMVSQLTEAMIVNGVV